ncbi:hypothetical protein NDU88_003998 [Pleurodeles waltl]|uniref:Uncharacterized protein n=1 Tax=Pleurodeles waltl TaxID=8319 RepID=A0AAV7NIJ1_PLEWA|nr:hypothetical protein NDU88_003998 [Pleurodeles waltl]
MQGYVSPFGPAPQWHQGYLGQRVPQRQAAQQRCGAMRRAKKRSRSWVRPPVVARFPGTESPSEAGRQHNNNAELRNTLRSTHVPGSAPQWQQGSLGQVVPQREPGLTTTMWGYSTH